MASGSIPFVSLGINNINKSNPKSVYRDGGLIDYHFDIDLKIKDGIVLYPHFYDFAYPGWFDKILKVRKPSSKNYERVVMLSPCKEFIAKLPYGKISDRNDFKIMDHTSRIKYWKTIIEMGKYLADDFHEMLEKDDILSRIIPFK